MAKYEQLRHFEMQPAGGSSGGYSGGVPSMNTGGDSIAAGIRQFGAGIERGRAEAKADKRFEISRDLEERKFRFQQKTQALHDQQAEQRLMGEKKALDLRYLSAMTQLASRPDLSSKEKVVYLKQFFKQMGKPTDNAEFRDFAQAITSISPETLQLWARTLNETFSDLKPGLVETFVNGVRTGELPIVQANEMISQIATQHRERRKTQTDKFGQSVPMNEPPVSSAPAPAGEPPMMAQTQSNAPPPPMISNPAAAAQSAETAGDLTEESSIATPQVSGQIEQLGAQLEPPVMSQTQPMPEPPRINRPTPVEAASTDAEFVGEVGETSGPVNTSDEDVLMGDGRTGTPPVNPNAPAASSNSLSKWEEFGVNVNNLPKPAENMAYDLGVGGTVLYQADESGKPILDSQGKAIPKMIPKADRQTSAKAVQAAGLADVLQKAMDMPSEFGVEATERAMGPWQASVTDTGSIGSAVGAVLGFVPQWIARTNAELEALQKGGASPTEVRDRIESQGSRISAMMKPLVRQPGEGTWTDKDQAFLEKITSGLTRSRSLGEYQRRLDDVKAYIEDTLGFELPNTVGTPLPEKSQKTAEEEVTWGEKPTWLEENWGTSRNAPPQIRRNQPSRK